MNRGSLAYAVGEVLELPHSNRQQKPYQIVNAIFDTIAKALQRGENVHIFGLGTFVITKRKESIDEASVLHKGIYYGRYNYKRKPSIKIRFRPSNSIVKVPNE